MPKAAAGKTLFKLALVCSLAMLSLWTEARPAQSPASPADLQAQAADTPRRARAGADAPPRRFTRTLRRHRRPADGLEGLRSRSGLGGRPLPRRGRGVHLDGNLHDPRVLGRRRRSRRVRGSRRVPHPCRRRSVYRPHAGRARFGGSPGECGRWERGIVCPPRRRKRAAPLPWCSRRN